MSIFHKSCLSDEVHFNIKNDVTRLFTATRRRSITIHYVKYRHDGIHFKVIAFCQKVFPFSLSNSFASLRFCGILIPYLMVVFLVRTLT